MCALNFLNRIMLVWLGCAVADDAAQSAKRAHGGAFRHVHFFSENCNRFLVCVGTNSIGPHDWVTVTTTRASLGDFKADCELLNLCVCHVALSGCVVDE